MLQLTMVNYVVMAVHRAFSAVAIIEACRRSLTFNLLSFFHSLGMADWCRVYGKKDMKMSEVKVSD